MYVVCVRESETLWVVGFELRSLGLAASTFTLFAISAALLFSLLLNFSQFKFSDSWDIEFIYLTCMRVLSLSLVVTELVYS